ncbi:MAG: phosphatidate cytidylyltransferase, partial [Candidatus Omnitrophica bacterium]|nr:phosphatidate cytidylyltransferase [Candidatus Omnitrophota bacterium]
MDKLLRRTFITIILISFVGIVVYFFPIWLFAIVISAFIAFAVFELLSMAQENGVFVHKYFGTITALSIPIFVYLGTIYPRLIFFESVLIILASLLVFIFQLTRKNERQDHLISMSVTLFSVFYIGWFFSFFVKIRMMDNGADIVAYLILVTKGSDIGAYLGGSKFGKTPLVPSISPKKTVEGAISGVVFAVIISLGFGLMLTDFSPVSLFVLGG